MGEKKILNINEDDFIDQSVTRKDGIIDPPDMEDHSNDMTVEESLNAMVKDANIEEDPIIIEPEENDPGQLVQVNIKQGNALQQVVGNPIVNDSLVESVKNDDPTSTILNTVLEEIAEEVAFLKSWRNQNWNGELDISESSFKRTRMLKQFVETVVEREKLRQSKNTGKIDFHSENFQRVLEHFLTVIQKTFKKVHIPNQYEDIFFSQLAKEFDGFEKRAEKIFYGKK